MTDQPFFVREPTADPVPLLVSIPHTGVEVPPEIAGRFASDAVRALPDTDWHLQRLYDFVPALGGRVLYARYGRYVIDLNRPPDSQPLYPGRFETGLVPTTTFDAEPLYREGEAPDEAEIAARRERYWRPYHARLKQELGALRERFGYALLFEAHSIRSEVPRLFEGRLPDLVLGDDDGRSAAKAISEAVLEVHRASAYESAHNSPFKGGYITRVYAGDGVEALQLEMRQALYMDEAPPFPYRADLAAAVRPVLEATLRAFIEAGRRRYDRAARPSSV